ncbi:glycosyltransferase family 4 protein [Nocardioides mangrovicus]|uniref:Glycosyltransferase family 4 protein n=1 Tax=Nocardioides mangrovicus TaxID=2478913 RepID=A0A3L8P428_9ACTN|nr:glycosyltransferase family 4 protein [Nocardioides mangrovicus]RLV49299.1 glycosyltransferase family 4 protein [Nocardioides mangrovicus]
MTASSPSPRVIIVATNASTVAGGEAIIPWHYFRLLRRRGVDVHLVTHERNREDLRAQPEMDEERVHFVRDTAASRRIHRWGMRLPAAVKPLTVWLVMAALSTVGLRREVRRVADQAPGAVVVHEPIPVSPKYPSLMTAVGGPLVVGPLNGGMEYPPGFRADARRSERWLRAGLRVVSGLAARLAPGRARAGMVLVANERTRRALPRAVRRVPSEILVENGVDLDLFEPRGPRSEYAEPVRFAFVGRLVDWKRVDLALQALARLPQAYCLDVVGDGPEGPALRRLGQQLGLAERVVFHGRLTQAASADVLAGCVALVLPSTYECGGAVVLEAMAAALPVVATDWGGPADYLDDGRTGVLVPPTDAEHVVAGFAAAMARLASDPDAAREMGRAGRREIERSYDWERKVDRLQTLYAEVAARA